MKTTVPAIAMCLALAATGIAAPRKPKKEKYPGIIELIEIPAVPEVKEPAAGKLITSDMTGRDLAFFKDTMEAGLLQAYLGELAKTKGDAEQVKKIGETFASTQAEENKQVGRLAALKGVTLDTATPAGQKKLAEELEPLSGPKFDKTVMERIVAHGQKAVTAYESAVQSKDTDIKSFVEQMLPVAKMKLQLASKMTGASVKTNVTPIFRTSTPPPPLR